MNEWLKKTLEKLKSTWKNWGLPQKLILIGVVVAVIAGIIILVSVSSAPSEVRLINTNMNESEVRLITKRLDDEEIEFRVAENNVIFVKDDETKARANSILLREDLIPKGTDPWDVFKMDKFTVTDFERNINLRNSITKEIIYYIEALEDVDKANVIIDIPEDKLFVEDQKPVSATVTIFPKPGSDITVNRKKIEGVQKIVRFAVSGLKDENIVITDQKGLQLNDFAGLEDFDRIEKTKREQQLVQKLEDYYRAQTLPALQKIFTPDRVRDINIKIDMDMSKKNTTTEEHFPFTMKSDNPITPYDDSVIQPSVTLSKETTTYEYQGTGFNPEGPAGVEGQTAPAYKDLQNMVGSAKQTHEIQNEAINKRQSNEEKSPTINRITVSVNIDGKWEIKKTAKGRNEKLPDGSIVREYTPLTQEDIKKATDLVKNAIGFKTERGDSITVSNIAIDRDKEFKEEDRLLMIKEQRDAIILYSLIGVALLLVAFILFRLASREMERRRRVAEEKRALQQQMIRENAIKDAEEQQIDVNMSVEERRRNDLQEHAINMAKEHPEEVAQLIRTWLREE